MNCRSPAAGNCRSYINPSAVYCSDIAYRWQSVQSSTILQADFPTRTHSLQLTRDITSSHYAPQMNRPRAPSTASYQRNGELSSRGAGSIADTANTTSIAAWVSGLCAALVIVLGFSIYMLHRSAPSHFISTGTRSRVAKSHDTLTAEELRSLDVTNRPFTASLHTSLGIQDEEFRGSTSSVPDLQDCSICAEPYHEGDTLRQLPCGHDFHRRCIDPWLTKRSGNCPLW